MCSLSTPEHFINACVLVLQSNVTIGPEDNILEETNPLYNIGALSVPVMLTYFSSKACPPELEEGTREEPQVCPGEL